MRKQPMKQRWKDTVHVVFRHLARSLLHIGVWAGGVTPSPSPPPRCSIDISFKDDVTVVSSSQQPFFSSLFCGIGMFAVLVTVGRGLQRSAVAATWLHGGEGEGGAHNAGRRGDPHHPTHAGPQSQIPAGQFILY
jgi:hypothetical protein